MLVAGAIGVTELMITLQDLPRAEREANEVVARVFGSYMSASLNNRVGEILHLAASTLVWTALSDSRDRDAYLGPFLRERNQALPNSRLALLDYRGRFVAGDEGLMPSGGGDAKHLVDEVLTSGKSASRLLRDSPGRFWIGAPIDYPYTHDKIGLLLGAIDLEAMLGEELAVDPSERGVIISTGDIAWRLRGAASSDAHAAASYRIQHAETEPRYDLELVVHSTGHPWLAGLITRGIVLALVSIALALVVWWVAGLAGHAVSRRLERLAAVIVQNPNCRPEDIPSDGQDDEISVLGDALRAALAAHRTAEEQLEQLAYYDGLTGLMNRRLFDERLGQALLRAQRTHTQVALLFIDLDRFKTVNDTLGHEVGDALLREVARRITERVRTSDAVSRRSGDEFTLLIETCPRQKGAVQLAEELIARLSQPYLLAGGRTVVVGASVGIAFYPSDAQSASQLLSRADAAMYAAKERGSGGYCLYSPDLGQEIRARLTLEARLGQAVREEGLEILFQPQVNLLDGHLLGVEALCRWRDQELGEVPPRVFIPVAEDTGAIRPLGLWLLRHACQEATGWGGLEDGFFLSLNVSAKQLTGEFPAAVREILRTTGWPASRLELELTEDSLTHAPPEAKVVLDSLQGMGVAVVMDDFGAGHSSLSCLKRFGFSKLKIDQGVIRNLVSSADDNLMVSTFINLSHQLGLQVIAEGVETEAQRDRLLQHGCDMAQGFLYGSPVTSPALRAMFVTSATAAKP